MAYIYEYIRTRGYEPMHFEEHYARLDTLSQSLFGLPLSISRKELASQIGIALRSVGCASSTINCVCVRYFDDEVLKIEVVEILYNKFSLRAIRPMGYICRLSGDLLLQNTSAKESMLELNRTTAQMAEGGVAIWVDEQNEVLAIDGAPVVAVFEDEIRFSRCGCGVEFEIAQEQASSRTRQITSDAIMFDDLIQAKELLAIDYRGVTALEGFSSHIYMDITAERIASQIVIAEKM